LTKKFPLPKKHPKFLGNGDAFKVIAKAIKGYLKT